MPVFTPKTVNDPSQLTHGRHPAFLLAIVEEAIPDGWEMGKKDTHMFRWHLAIWEHPDHVMQYAPEEQSAISSRAFSPKSKYQASKAYVWTCALLGREIPRGQGADLDPLLPLACWADIERTPGNDYAKITALWGRPEGQAQIPPVVHQLKAQYATGMPPAPAAAPPPPAPAQAAPAWQMPPPPQPGPAAHPAQRTAPVGYPQPAPQAPAQPPLPGTAPRGAGAGVPF